MKMSINDKKEFLIEEMCEIHGEDNIEKFLNADNIDGCSTINDLYSLSIEDIKDVEQSYKEHLRDFGI